MAIEATVYPTRKPELARTVELEQVMKLEGIGRALVERQHERLWPFGGHPQ
jgi:hypothetical protein